MPTPNFLDNVVGSDNLRIIVLEDPEDSETWFGHDVINGGGQGIGELAFRGGFVERLAA